MWPLEFPCSSLDSWPSRFNLQSSSSLKLQRAQQVRTSPKHVNFALKPSTHHSRCYSPTDRGYEVACSHTSVRHVHINQSINLPSNYKAAKTYRPPRSPAYPPIAQYKTLIPCPQTTYKPSPIPSQPLLSPFPPPLCLYSLEWP